MMLICTTRWWKYFAMLKNNKQESCYLVYRIWNILYFFHNNILCFYINIMNHLYHLGFVLSLINSKVSISFQVRN